MIENLEKKSVIEDVSSEKASEKEPRDKFKIVLIMFYLMGTLISPPTFFSTASDYWLYKFRNTSLPYDPVGNRTSLQAQFLANFGIAVTVTMVVVIFLATAFLRSICADKKIKYSLGSVSLMFVATLALAVSNTDNWQFEFYILSLVVGILVACVGSVYLMSVFTLLEDFPPRYLAAALTGQSLMGIITALLQIACLAISPNSITTAVLYFGTGLVLLLLTLSMYLITSRKSTFYKHLLSAGDKKEKVVFMFEWSECIKLFKQAKFHFIALVVISAITPMVSPGMLSLVVSENSARGAWETKFFVPVITFLGVHSFDLIGRETAVKFKGLENIKVVLFLSILRIAFVPIFMFCNAQPRHLPVLFDHDGYFITWVMVFAFSQGYLVNKVTLGLAYCVEKHQYQLMMLSLMVILIVTQAISSVLGTVFVNLL